MIENSPLAVPLLRISQRAFVFTNGNYLPSLRITIYTEVNV